jgi:CheY-like chemotaxis protein/GGDEF domain-containing protein
MEKILFVDDENAVLDGYRRLLFRDFPVVTAVGGERGLATIRDNGPFAVVISDMRMPGMDGAEFLAEVRKAAPFTVRMLLTGHADLDSAIEAVNKGNIFRFLTKPCQKDVLVEAINSGLAKYRAAVAEKELAKKGEMIGRSDAEWDAAAPSPEDKSDGLAGLPGAEEARSYVQAMFGKDSQCFVVLFKLTLLQTVAERYGEEAAAEYLISAVQFLKGAFWTSDKLFQWNREVIMAVVERQVRPAAVRMEVQRLLMDNQQHVLELNGRKVMIAYSATFDLLPVAQFSSLDQMFEAFIAKQIGRI